ncbi:MAG TPA: L-2-hydroxyglutarate oxidase [Acidimicrobiales bacterium]|nr:L-2-hydroxyglutarate oxidase [Acidimicrobiales bacterium]
MTDRPDIAVIGAGILGLATARELLIRHPDLAVTVLDKEDRVAAHQTGHNSGVLHAGLYYAPGSLKARLCREGKEAMERLAEEHGIPVDRCGKLVVALDESELGRFEDLRQRAEANGVEGLEVLGPEGIAEREPHAAGIRALWSPGTGIIDFGRVARVLADDVVARGGTLALGRPVERIERRTAEVVLDTTTGPVVAAHVVACAGLHADALAHQLGDDGPERIVPFRGDYYTLVGGSKSLVNGLIYPVPDPRFPFLGVHLTKRIDGEVLAGPNAVLAFAREGYRRRDVRLRELAGVVGEPGFRRLAVRYWRTGAAEMWRDVSKRAFLRALQRYVPALRSEHLRFGPSGVRAQAVDPDGTLVDDFRLGGDDRALTVRNAPSPAATASLAIAAVLAARAEEQFAALDR